MKRRVALIVAVCSLALPAPGVALGQDSTPVATTFPVTPDPAECRVEARSVEEFLAISAGGIPVATPPVVSAVEIPLGQAADAETVAGVIATAREILACFNAGDFPRAFSLFSVDMLRQITAEGSPSEDAVRALLYGAPEAVPVEERTTLVAVTDVTELGEGRVGAFLATTGPSSGPDTIYVTFIQGDGRWLMDAVVEFLVPGGSDEEGESTPGT